MSETKMFVSGIHTEEEVKIKKILADDKHLTILYDYKGFEVEAKIRIAYLHLQLKE